MYHIFIHLSVNAHLGCFHDLAIVNSATMNIVVHVSFWIMTFSGYSPVVEILGHMVILFLVFFFFLKKLVFNLFLFIFFLAILGLCFCTRAFSSCGKWGPLFIAVRGPLTIMASLVAEHRLQTRRLSSCGSEAQLLHGMWILPDQGSNPCPLH